MVAYCHFQIYKCFRKIKDQDAFKFNDMGHHNGTEVGSVMGRFDIRMQADEVIQYHQAGLGGLRNEKR